jgi:hypothetical protein
MLLISECIKSLNPYAMIDHSSSHLDGACMLVRAFGGGFKDETSMPRHISSDGSRGVKNDVKINLAFPPNSVITLDSL